VNTGVPLIISGSEWKTWARFIFLEALLSSERRFFDLGSALLLRARLPVFMALRDSPPMFNQQAPVGY